jgi:Glutathione S-transferase, N-terminal domain
VSLPLLWQYSFSNFNEKARWALDFKRIPHRRNSLLPGGPKAIAFSRGEGTLPVLELEDYFDEHAGHDMRRVGFWELRDERAYGGSFLTTDQGRAKRLAVKSRDARDLPGRVALHEQALRLQRGGRRAQPRGADRGPRSNRVGAGRWRLPGRGRVHRRRSGRGGAAVPARLAPELQYEFPEPPPSEFLDSLADHPAVGWIGETYRSQRGESAEVIGRQP